MITRLEVKGYKAFKYVNLSIANFNILVGPNASGKSTLLDIFKLIKDILEGGPKKAVEERSSRFQELLWQHEGDKFEIAIEFTLPDNLQEKMKNKNIEKARYEITINNDAKAGNIIEIENLWLIKRDGGAPIKSNQQLDLFPREPSPPESIVTTRKKPTGWRKVISKSSKGNDYFRSEITDWNINYRFGPYKSSLARVPEDEERFPVCLWIKERIMEGIQYIQLNSTAMRSACRPDSPSSFQIDGSNLPKVVSYLHNQDLKNFIRWQKHIRDALPEIKKIGVQERSEDRYLYIFIHYRNNLIVPSWLLSDGTLRFLAQTLIAYLPDKGRFYMIEEPENGLHPLAIDSLYQSLSSLYDNQIILATHSPSILRLAEPKDILCFSKTKSGAVDIVRGDQHPRLKDWKKDVDIATLHAAGILQ
jgi:predicted ATPase